MLGKILMQVRDEIRGPRAVEMLVITTQSRRAIAFVLATALGFIALAGTDAWRPITSWFDRLNVWLVGFAMARALGAFAGAPINLRRSKSVTKKGLLAAFVAVLGHQVLGWSLLWEVVGPYLEVRPSWRVDLILGAVVLATMPLYLLSVRIETPAN
jgi:hypothetical protein